MQRTHNKPHPANRPEAQRSQIRIGKQKTRVWEYLKIKNVTTVTTVTAFPYLGNSEDSKISKYGSGVTPVTPVTAKDCVNWHKASCEHPNPDCLTPMNPCPGSCHSFKKISLGESQAEMPNYEQRIPDGEDEP